jgi:hypothetical protein
MSSAASAPADRFQDGGRGDTNRRFRAPKARFEPRHSLATIRELKPFGRAKCLGRLGPHGCLQSEYGHCSVCGYQIPAPALGTSPRGSMMRSCGAPALVINFVAARPDLQQRVSNAAEWSHAVQSTGSVKALARAMCIPGRLEQRHDTLSRQRGRRPVEAAAASRVRKGSAGLISGPVSSVRYPSIRADHRSGRARSRWERRIGSTLPRRDRSSAGTSSCAASASAVTRPRTDVWNG